jgi:hypothetical protein
MAENQTGVLYVVSYFNVVAGQKKFDAFNVRHTNERDALIEAMKYVDRLVKLPTEGRNTAVIERISGPTRDISLEKVLPAGVSGINYSLVNNEIHIIAGLAEQYGLTTELARKPADSGLGLLLT